MTINDAAILTKTRAEEHDADIWGEFFLPPFFSRLRLKTATKSTYIIGKRGSGKTMLLKYLDYHTAFSSRRHEIPAEEIKHIGIYWRVDTQFCSSLKYRDIDEQQWATVFENYFSLCMSIEIIKSLRVIADSSFKGFDSASFNLLAFPSVLDFHPDFPSEIAQLERFLERTRRLFTTWVSNVSSVARPLMPPGRVFLEALIADIKSIIPFKDGAFYIYIDEVENLVPYQRRVLNTYLKHSQRPLIVNFTSKEQSSENQTTGNEWVNATHDYHLLDLDTLLSDRERPLFFAEVFLANIDIAEGRENSRLLEIVQSPSALLTRQESAYRTSTIKSMRDRFPTYTLKEFAENAFRNEKLHNKLVERITRALKNRNSDIGVDSFLQFDNVAEALLVLPAVLSRANQNPADVLQSLQLYSTQGKGSFESTWVQNNLFGSLLELYRPYGRECPIYSGFDTYCTMSNNNLRNFLILSYKALEVAELRDEEIISLSVETQSRAAYEAAEQLVREIKTFGKFGEQLRMFVLRLGSIFRALQALPTMSEPEQNQLTINSGKRAFSDEEIVFIRETIKYAILVEQLETKAKDAVGNDIIDFQLNPIYSPYFQISYRRKRKIEISVEQFHTLYAGTEDEYRLLAKGFARDITEVLDNGQLGLI